MLQDGFWKKDIKKIKRKLAFWSRCGLTSFRDYSDHIMNRCLLFSSAIIRKIIEDEADAERIIKEKSLSIPPFKILHYKVKVTRFDYTGNDPFYSPSKPNLSDYDLKNSEPKELPLKELCNQFIHSYIWAPVHHGKKRLIYGAMFASDRDKEKYAYLIQINEWIDMLNFVADNCNIYSRRAIFSL